MRCFDDVTNLPGEANRTSWIQKERGDRNKKSGIYGSNQRDNADRKSKQINCINYINKMGNSKINQNFFPKK